MDLHDAEDEFFGNDDEGPMEGFGDDGSLREAETRAIEQRYYNIGFEGAIEEGKERALQRGFDQGYQLGFGEAFDQSARESTRAIIKSFSRYSTHTTSEIESIIDDLLGESSKTTQLYVGLTDTNSSGSAQEAPVQPEASCCGEKGNPQSSGCCGKGK